MALLTFIRLIYAGLVTNSRGATVLVLGLNVTDEDLVYFLIAVFTGSLAHEYSHARTAARSGVAIKAISIVIAFIMPAAFLEISDENFREKKQVIKTAVLAAELRPT